MQFNKIINKYLKEDEDPSREDRIKALSNLEDNTIDDFVYEGEFEDDHETCCAFTYKGLEFSLWWCGEEVATMMSNKDPELLYDLGENLNRMIEKSKDENDVMEVRTDWGTLFWGWN
jgi:hypothetical protein